MSRHPTLLLALIVIVQCSGPCPVWTIYNRTTDRCECGTSLNKVVHCERNPHKVTLLLCYCMTYSEGENTTVVGPCLAKCAAKSYYDKAHYLIETNDTTMLNSVVCGPLHRTGQHCGSCMEGYGLPVYSYTLECVKCSESNFKSNLLKYLAVAFLPLTLFYLLVIVFKVSATSGYMVAFVLTSQIATTSTTAKLYTVTRIHESVVVNIMNSFISYFSIWNLDFFRSLYSPFCIHPKLTTLNVIALDYLIGIYPLLLIFLTYIAVSLHDRYSVVVKLWKPAYKFLTHIRREWSIRGSLIQAFATFLILSYVKILNVSFDILMPVHLQTVEGKSLPVPYLYNDGEILYFRKKHLPYAILAIIMITVFNIVPMMLLFLYPCRCFKKYVTSCGRSSLTLQTFMDAFLGCYCHHPRDCRYFAAIYLLVRIFHLSIFAVVNNRVYYTTTGLYLIVLAVAVMFLKPYKNRHHNLVDGTIFLTYACICLLQITGAYIRVYEPQLSIALVFSTPITLLLLGLVIYGCAILLPKFIPKIISEKFKDYCSLFVTRRADTNTRNTEMTLPQFQQENEHTPLL